MTAIILLTLTGVILDRIQAHRRDREHARNLAEVMAGKWPSKLSHCQ
jgi:hypothetical protein